VKRRVLNKLRFTVFIKLEQIVVNSIISGTNINIHKGNEEDN